MKTEKQSRQDLDIYLKLKEYDCREPTLTALLLSIKNFYNPYNSKGEIVLSYTKDYQLFLMDVFKSFKVNLSATQAYDLNQTIIKILEADYPTQELEDDLDDDLDDKDIETEYELDNGELENE